ncbi:MAG: glutamyl-tRNA reductase [Bacillaceae bacterium]
MYVIVATLNHHTAPVKIRECFSFSEQEIGIAMTALKEEKSILENVIVSTCNRTEIYAVVDQLHTSRFYLKRFLGTYFKMDIETFNDHLLFYENDDAISHLLKVTCGLDSMIVGETQILGQVKSSFLLGQQRGTTGSIFNMLFKQAITFAKKVHATTALGEHAVSVSYAAVELAKNCFATLDGQRVCIVGAGKMSELALQNLKGHGVGEITIVNRTYEKGKEVALRYGGTAADFELLEDVLVNTDIVITSTGARIPVVTGELMTTVMERRNNEPIVFIDIAVPRDVEPEVALMANVYLYDIDHLEQAVASNIHERMLIAKKIEMQIQDEVEIFNKWLHTLGVVPILSALRDKALTIQTTTLDSLERKLPNLEEREYVIIRKHFKSIINQMLKDPILKAKELAAQPDANEKLQLFVDIFNLEKQLQSEEKVLFESNYRS